MYTSKMAWMAALVLAGVAGTSVTAFAGTAADTTRTTAFADQSVSVPPGAYRFEGLSRSQVRPDGLMVNGLLPTSPDAQG